MCVGLDEEICAEPVIVVVGACRGPMSEESCPPWFVGCYFLLQTDLYIHRISPTLSFSLPKSVSEQVQFVGPAGFELGLSSFSSHLLKLLHVLTAHFPRKPSARHQSLRCFGLGMDFALWCISKS